MQFSIDLRELGSEKNPARIAFGEIVKEGKEVFLIGNALNLIVVFLFIPLYAAVCKNKALQNVEKVNNPD